MGNVVNQMAALNVSDEEKIATDRIESTQYLLSALSELEKCTKMWHLREWIRKANEMHQGRDILYKVYGIYGTAELIKEGKRAFHRAKALMIRKIASGSSRNLSESRHPTRQKKLRRSQRQKSRKRLQRRKRPQRLQRRKSLQRPKRLRRMKRLLLRL